MAPAPATRAPGGAAPTRLISNSKGSLLVPSPIQLPRRAGGNRAVLLGVGRRDGWSTDNNGSSSSEGGRGRMVDEDMATLRRRIHEARAQSAEEDGVDIDGDADADVPLPAGWTEMERRHHGSYVEVTRGAAALLVSARPGLGAGLLAMLLLGVPASMFLVCAHLIKAAGSAWSG